MREAGQQPVKLNKMTRDSSKSSVAHLCSTSTPWFDQMRAPSGLDHRTKAARPTTSARDTRIWIQSDAARLSSSCLCGHRGPGPLRPPSEAAVLALLCWRWPGIGSPVAQSSPAITWRPSTDGGCQAGVRITGDPGEPKPIACYPIHRKRWHCSSRQMLLGFLTPQSRDFS